MNDFSETEPFTKRLWSYFHQEVELVGHLESGLITSGIGSPVASEEVRLNSPPWVSATQVYISSLKDLSVWTVGLVCRVDRSTCRRAHCSHRCHTRQVDCQFTPNYVRQSSLVTNKYPCPGKDFGLPGMNLGFSLSRPPLFNSAQWVQGLDFWRKNQLVLQQVPVNSLSPQPCFHPTCPALNQLSSEAVGTGEVMSMMFHNIIQAV